jgi:hypothetical protein
MPRQCVDDLPPNALFEDIKVRRRLRTTAPRKSGHDRE